MQSLTQASVEAAWAAFTQKRIAETNNSNEEVALKRTVLLEGLVLKLVLENDLQESVLNALKTPLLDYLRATFNQPSLTLSHKVAPDEVERRPYTPQEKLNFLIRKNPAILELQERLGLDVNF